MPPSRRHISIPPEGVLKELAKVHYYLSLSTNGHPNRYGLKEAAIATFSAMVWGLSKWQDALKAAANEGPPTLDQSQIDYLKSKGHLDPDHQIRALAVLKLELVVDRIRNVDANLAVVLDWCCFEGLGGVETNRELQSVLVDCELK